MDVYQQFGLKLSLAENAVETGLTQCWTLLVEGRFKVMRKCQNFQKEYKKYHRDEKGVIVKKNDHLMDAFRYWVMSGRDKLSIKPKTKTDREPQTRRGQGTWMRS